MQTLNVGSQDVISNADAHTHKKKVPSSGLWHPSLPSLPLVSSSCLLGSLGVFFEEVPSFLRTFGGCRCHGTGKVVPAAPVGHDECLRQRRVPAVGAKSLA